MESQEPCRLSSATELWLPRFDLVAAEHNVQSDGLAHTRHCQDSQSQLQITRHDAGCRDLALGTTEHLTARHRSETTGSCADAHAR